MSEHGQISSMPEEQYRAADGLNFSNLKILMQRSPAHLYAAMHGPKEEATPAMRLGSLTHTAILQPELASFVVRPEGMTFTTKEGKAWRDAQTQTIITTDEGAAIESMKQSVMSHPMAKRLLAKGSAEQSLFGRDASGLMRKGRLDFIPQGSNAIVDLKTCIDASPDEFAKQVGNLGYLFQAYYYLKLAKLCGLERQTFFFIAVEKSAPYAVAIYQVPDDYIRAAGLLVEAAVQTYRNCVEANKWPGYGDTHKDLILPAWAEKQLPLQAA